VTFEGSWKREAKKKEGVKNRGEDWQSQTDAVDFFWSTGGKRRRKKKKKFRKKGRKK